MATASSRDAQISALVPIVHRLATYLRKAFGAAVDEADLIGAGYEAIVRAYDRYDPSRDPSFESYAKHRAFNAMQNAVRAWLPGPETPREKMRHAEAFKVDFAAANGRFPTAQEIEKRLPGYIKALTKANLLALVYLDAPNEHGDVIEISDDTTTEDVVLVREEHGVLKRLLLMLGDLQWDIIKRHYFGGESLKDIARGMSVHPSRVSQIHNKALRQMREATRA